MSKKLRILLVEDDTADAELVELTLRNTPLIFSVQQVQTKEEFLKALNEQSPDVILADYRLPRFGSTAALQLIKEHQSDVPLISISGTVGEESAVELMRLGASDHILKKDLGKLPSAIQRALREREQKTHQRTAEAALRESEARFRAIFGGVGSGIAVEDLNGRIMDTNRALQQMLGYSDEELQQLTRQDFTHSRDNQEEQIQYNRLLSGESDFFQVEKRFVRKDGRLIWGSLTVSMVRDAAGQPQFTLAMIEDITERQIAEEAHLQDAAIIENSNDAIISQTFDGIIFTWNAAAERVYGYTANEANGRSSSIIVPPDKEEEHERILERIKRGERIDNFETTRLRKDGSLIYVSVTTSPIKDVASRIVNVSAISRDITERKRAEAALLESEENYRKLVELSPDGILIQSGGKYVYLNSAALEIFGARTTGEVVGRAVLDLVHPDYHEIVRENLKRLTDLKDVPLHEEKLIRVDGLMVDVEAMATPFVYRGEPAFQVVVRNITERKRAEQALRKSEAALARGQRIAHLGSWELDLRTDALVWSEETYRIFGLTPGESECSTKIFFRAVHPDDRALVLQAVEEAINNRKPYSVDHRIVLPNGEVKTVNEQAELVFDEKGVAARMLGTVLDITKRKRAENLGAAFSKLGERLSSATTSREAAGIIADEADKLFGWDACNLALCSPDLTTFHDIFSQDLIKGERRDLAPSEQPLTPSARMIGVLEDGAQLILRESGEKISDVAHRFGDHSKPSASMMYVPVRNNAKIIGVFSIHSYAFHAYTQQDLEAFQALGDHCGGALERIRAESENQKLAAFPQFNPNPVLEFTHDATINYYNGAAEQMAQSLGYEHPSDLLPPETTATVRDSLATGQIKRLQNVIDDRTLSWSFFPIQAIGVVHCYAADITDRQNLEAQLRQAQKMESIGQLAGGVAHDFNNILTVIQGHISLLAMGGNLSPEASESAQQIGLAAERAANLTRQLLTFSRRQVMQPKNLDLNGVVNNMTKMLHRLLGEDVTLQVSYTPGLPAIHADPGMVEQILLNLSVNARDAMPRGGSLFIETHALTVDQAYADHVPEAVPGQYVCLTVKDTGKGIPPNVLPHIFEPFFTTKDVGKGTGLGLATVYGIVQQHRGWVEVNSTVDKETVFRIYIPAVKGRAAATSDTEKEPKVRGGKETILVVEDEPPLRMLVRNVLERYGYTVLEAVSGVAALPIWEQHKGKIQLLLTDMVMPHGISGRELAQKCLAERPELKVIYSSGYSLAVVGADMVLREGINFLQKPYHPRKLARAVRDCLDADTPTI